MKGETKMKKLFLSGMLLIKPRGACDGHCSYVHST